MLRVGAGNIRTKTIRTAFGGVFILNKFCRQRSFLTPT
jgi:hypothetical protein